MTNPNPMPAHEAAMAADVLCDAVALIESGRPAVALESIMWALHLLPDCGREEQRRMLPARSQAVRSAS